MKCSSQRPSLLSLFVYSIRVIPTFPPSVITSIYVCVPWRVRNGCRSRLTKEVDEKERERVESVRARSLQMQYRQVRWKKSNRPTWTGATRFRQSSACVPLSLVVIHLFGYAPALSECFLLWLMPNASSFPWTCTADFLHPFDCSTGDVSNSNDRRRTDGSVWERREETR